MLNDQVGLRDNNCRNSGICLGNQNLVTLTFKLFYHKTTFEIVIWLEFYCLSLLLWANSTIIFTGLETDMKIKVLGRKQTQSLLFINTELKYLDAWPAMTKC